MISAKNWVLEMKYINGEVALEDGRCKKKANILKYLFHC
jgi:hypothetical protein